MPSGEERPARELVVMVGLQGSGKSTWVARHLAGRTASPSLDHWPNVRRREARQLRLVGELLAEGERVAVDNTNPTPDERAPLVAAARRAGVPARAVWVDTPLPVCLERNSARTGRGASRSPGSWAPAAAAAVRAGGGRVR